MKDNKSFRRIDKGDIPREFKENTLIGLQGLCCVTHPEFIRKNSLLGKKIKRELETVDLFECQLEPPRIQVKIWTGYIQPIVFFVGKKTKRL